MLEDGVTETAAALIADEGRVVTYTRRSAVPATVSLMAVIGQTSFRTTDEDGRSTLVRSDRDYLILAADLVLDSEATDPKVGDRITDGDEVYEVYRPVAEPCFRRADPYGVMLRIHTRWES
jgi:hypothetical protein